MIPLGHDGALAQLVERLICIQEVSGSIPLGSTKNCLFVSVLSVYDALMNICAMTMVYQDYWALAQWIRHYSKQLGIENLYVVVHGPDKKINEIAAGVNIWTIPRDNLERFDKRRNKMLNQFQSGLLQFYDWVIRTDADELICVDPNMHGTLHGLLNKQTDDTVFAVGLNLYEGLEDGEMVDDASVFDMRCSAIITGNYSKAWAVSVDTPLMRHGVRVAEDGELKYSHAFPEGVFLVHLKFAHMPALVDANETRKSLARSDLPGMPGLGWRKAESHARRFFETASGMKLTAWDEAIEQARIEILTDMKFSEDDGVLRSPGIPYICRTELPDWFKDN